jgi:isopentenyl-diphosphate delta-isomerase
MSDERKQDHIKLAFKSVPSEQVDLLGSHYEPLFSAHPAIDESAKEFMGHEFKMPLWVSSMTGGTEKALTINKNLARACKEFGLGMGLGSCRPLLESSERFSDFNMRPLIGDAPLYTNFGIAQLEDLIDAGELNKISEITKSLEANGIIIHVNPLQEWAQPEGDVFRHPPIETISKVLDSINYPIIVKEVGQGFGPRSIEALMKMPLSAIEFGGFGGTNFTMLEHARLPSSISVNNGLKAKFGNIGHSPAQMINWVNNSLKSQDAQCSNFIISGGVKDPLTAHILMNSLEGNSIVGMASELLKYSMGSYEELQNYLEDVKDCFNLAQAYIRG